MTVNFQYTVGKTIGAASSVLPVNVTAGAGEAGTVQVIPGTVPAGCSIGGVAATPIVAGQTLALNCTFGVPTDPGRMDSLCTFIVRFTPTVGNVQDFTWAFFMRALDYETAVNTISTVSKRCLYDRYILLAFTPAPDSDETKCVVVGLPVLCRYTDSSVRPTSDADSFLVRPGEVIPAPNTPDLRLWARGANLWPGNGLPVPAAYGDGYFEEYPAIVTCSGNEV